MCLNDIKKIEKDAKDKAIQFFNKTRVSPYLPSLISPAMPAHVNSKKLLVTPPVLSARATFRNLMRGISLEMIAKRVAPPKPKVQPKAKENGLKFKAGDKVKVMFTVNGKDDYYPGQIQRITNIRKKLYTLVFENDDAVYRDIHEDEILPIEANNNHSNTTNTNNTNENENSSKATQPTITRSVSCIPPPDTYYKSYNWYFLSFILLCFIFFSFFLFLTIFFPLSFFTLGMSIVFSSFFASDGILHYLPLYLLSFFKRDFF